VLNSSLPPGRIAEETRSSRYLSLLERQRIAPLRESGHNHDAVVAAGRLIMLAASRNPSGILRST